MDKMPPKLMAKMMEARMWMERGQQYAESRNFEQAIQAWEKAGELYPLNPGLWLDLAHICLIASKPKKAKHACEMAMGFDLPPDALEFLLKLWVDLDDHSGAVKVANELLKKVPGHPIARDVVNGKMPKVSPADALNNEAVRLIEAGRYSEAEQKLRQAVEKEPGFWEAWQNLSVLVRKMGRVDEEGTLLQKVISIDPKNARAWTSLGFFHANQGKYAEAEKEYRKAIELDPQYDVVWFNLGGLLRDIERYDESEKALREAARLNPMDAMSWMSLSRTLMYLHRCQDALAAARRGVELEPRTQVIRWQYELIQAHLAGKVDFYALDAQGKEEDKKRRAQMFAEGDSVSVEIRSIDDKCVIYVTGRPPGPWMGISGKVTLIPPVNTFALPATETERDVLETLKRGIAQAGAGNLNNAENIFRELAERVPEVLEAQRNWGVSLLQQGRPKEAEVVFRLMQRDWDRDPVPWLLLGHALHEQGKTDEARSTYLSVAFGWRTLDRYGAINLNSYEVRPP